MPWSSPRSSGWRATAWIIEPKMLPIPMPAPSAPRPIPSASAMALPASATLPSTAPTMERADMWCRSSLVLRLDGRADVDGRQGSEDIGLDRHDDHDLEQIERDCSRHGDDADEKALEHEDEPDERQDQHVACEHVGVETNGEADQPHELAEDLERDDQRVERLGDIGNPALQVSHDAVGADFLDMR